LKGFISTSRIVSFVKRRRGGLEKHYARTQGGGEFKARLRGILNIALLLEFSGFTEIAYPNKTRKKCIPTYRNPAGFGKTGRVTKICDEVPP